MHRPLRFLKQFAISSTILLFPFLLLAQTSTTPASNSGDVEVLSDTMGVNFGPYLQGVLATVKSNWLKLIPETARPPVMKRGLVAIEFAILKDGKLAGLRVIASSGDIALDRAAYGALTNSNPLPPLPGEFRGKYLQLRIKFRYNPEPGTVDSTPKAAPAKSTLPRIDLHATPPATVNSDEIDLIVKKVLTKTGVPSASVAVVKDRKLAYVQAYGSARLDPLTPARPEMRYSIGSISKQFTAAAILMLAEEGKLSLDDPVSKFISGLTRGDQVTIRQLLSHTSGYQDYWPQDYVPPFMLTEVSATKILDLWARKPLDFDPGTRWQYSNTNFVIAGLIVEKAAGMPLLEFLNQRVFTPLGMKSVKDIDQDKLTSSDATGYCRYALGPPRLAPKEGRGWLFAAGELAMTAEDLEKWNISLMQQSLLKPESYRTMETEAQLKNGAGAGYDLGLSVGKLNGHRVLRHGGEVSGFTSTNIVLPDDGIAVTVLTNQDAINAAGQIGREIAEKLLTGNQPDPNADLARKVLEALSHGQIDRSLFTENANAYFSDVALKDFASSLAPLGALESLAQTDTYERGGMIYHEYNAKYAGKTLSLLIFQMPDGKFEQFQISEQE